jgi:hypothetical protein
MRSWSSPKNRAELEQRIDLLREAAQHGALTWLAYPKARQLETDLNRDIIRDLALDRGLDPVRQVSIDDIWSALRLKPARGEGDAGALGGNPEIGGHRDAGDAALPETLSDLRRSGKAADGAPVRGRGLHNPC